MYKCLYVKHLKFYATLRQIYINFLFRLASLQHANVSKSCKYFIILYLYNVGLSDCQLNVLNYETS